MIQRKLKQTFSHTESGYGDRSRAINLEGLEDLLEGVFESEPEEQGLAQKSPYPNYPHSNNTNVGLMSADNRTQFPGSSLRFKSLFYESEPPKPGIDSKNEVHYEILKAEYALLSARLHFALQELEAARVRESLLKIQIAALEDQRRLTPEPLVKPARLMELESELKRLLKKAVCIQ